MTLWLVFLALTVATLAAVVAPLFRARAASAKRADYDLAVYKDQLREVERDRARGAIAAAAAESARLEIERRLLAAAADLETSESAAQSFPRAAAWRWTTMLLLLLVPGAALIYLDHGVPGLPSMPLAERITQSDAREKQFVDLIAQVEQRLAENPDDIRGWVLLARGYVRLGRNDDALRAQARAMDLFDAEPDMAGEAADAAAAFGELLVQTAGGQITPQARTAFGKALSYDDRNARARYFLALAKMQDGDPKAAVADWKALIADAPDNVPWLADLKAQIENIEKSRSQSPGGQPAGQP